MISVTLEKAPTPGNGLNDILAASRKAARAGCVLTIDAGAISRNWRRLAAMGAAREVSAVVKADGYGLGLSIVAPALRDAGARLFFVAHLEEALTLRQILPDARIAVLNGLTPGCEADYDQSSIMPVLNQLEDIARWAAWCQKSAVRRPAFIHLDTAMNRLGLDWGEQDDLAADPSILGSFIVSGYLTHPSAADDIKSTVLVDQRTAFDAIRARLPAAPASIANSPAMFRRAGQGLDMARPGCALYGVNPTPEAENPMEGVVMLHARIIQIRTVRKGDRIGYGGATAADRTMTIATLAIGYADGYLRSVGNRGRVFINGKSANIVGRVSMDLTTVDISGILDAGPDAGIAPGDWVEVIGPNMPVDTVAANAGTIGYEILTGLGRRYHRHVVIS